MKYPIHKKYKKYIKEILNWIMFILIDIMWCIQYKSYYIKLLSVIYI